MMHYSETQQKTILRRTERDILALVAVDLDTEEFEVLYTNGGYRDYRNRFHGSHFFTWWEHTALPRIYEEDRELFLNAFSKEKIIKELEMHGVFAMTYRLIDSGSPIYASLKVTRVQGENKIILGVSIVEAQIRREEQTLQSQME